MKQKQRGVTNYIKTRNNTNRHNEVSIRDSIEQN